MAEKKSNVSYKLPPAALWEHMCKLALVEDKPIMLDYWTDSLEKNVLITEEDILESMPWVISLGDRKYLNLFEGGESTDFDVLAREYTASSKNNKFTIADAFVIESMAHDMIVNFYMKFHKPIKPTKMFKNRKDAVQWLLTFKNGKK